tara:strand:- start:885 stop:8972 length:8088 start_codon:yes stop_codon:yes gene_type:complete
LIYRLLKYSYLFTFFFISNLIYSQGWCPPSVDENNRALEFDGIDDFVNLPYIFNPNEDFTISFWYYKDSWGTAGTDIVLCQKTGNLGGGTEPGMTIIAQDPRTSSKRARHRSFLNGNNKYMEQELELNKWTHIALVHDTNGGSTYPNGELQWYYNGIKHGKPDNMQNAKSNNDGGFLIGKNRQSASYFKGLIDEFRIWNTTRTSAQIQNDLHNNADPTDTSLLVHFNMETVTSTTLVNNSFWGSLYNGTLTNGVTSTLTTNSAKLTSFVYNKNSYNKTEKNPTPLITGESGGVFSSSAGLVLDAGTGQIDISASTPGAYTVNYTIPASCGSASSKVITITPSNTIDFSYPNNTVCLTEGIVSPTLINGGPSGGIYYSEPLGLFLDKDSGNITTASSTVGDYEVFYSRDSNLGSWTKIGEIDPQVGAFGKYSNQNRFGISVRLNAAGNFITILAPNENSNFTRASQMESYFYDPDSGNWEKVGHNIGGDTVQPNWQNGNTSQIAVNDNGDIIAVTNSKNDIGCNDCGSVRVFKRKNGIWSSLGNPIFGTTGSQGEFGLSIALNSPGNIIAIGDNRSNEDGVDNGVVHMYEFDGTDWVRKGGAGPNEGRIFPAAGVGTNRLWGWSVDLDSTGNTVIIGSKDYDNGSDNLGKAVVYKFDGANWNQYGLNTLEPNSLKNDNMGRGFGADVSINADGNIIIIGDPDNDQDTNPDSGANQNSGRSHAYKYNANTNLWEKLGWADVFSASNTNTLNRDLDELYSGHSVALNSNGSVAAIGEPQKYEKDDLGSVSIYRQTQEIISGQVTTTWTREETISGVQNKARFGWSVDINAKGDVVAVGAPNYEISGNGGIKDEGKVYIYKRDFDETRDPFKIKIVDSGTYDTTISYPGSPTLNQGDSPITPTINESGGTFTVTPTYSSIEYSGEWGPSGAYYLSIDPITGVISPSVSLAGTYSITYTIGCDSTTRSITIRSVNDIDHTLTYSPTTACLEDGNNLRPNIIPTTNHSTVPRIYLDPGNINSYANVGSASLGSIITNLTTNSSYSHWRGPRGDDFRHHPNFQLGVNGSELEHIPGYSWKINSTHENNHIRQENAGSNSRRSFPRDDFSISLWVNETNWSDGTTIINFANSSNTSGQFKFYYSIAGIPSIFINGATYSMGNFLPNNNQWYNFIITRQKAGDGTSSTLKFFVNGELKHTELGTTAVTLQNIGDIRIGREIIAVGGSTDNRAFVGQFGPIKIFSDALSQNEVEYEFDSFAPRYLTDSFNSSPAGLSIDINTGIIDIAGSVTGTYSVTLSWTEPIASTLQSAQTSLTIETGIASFTYPEIVYCQSTIGIVTPTITGVTSGTFTVSPTGLSIDPITGAVSPSVSSVATYTIIYTTPGICSTLTTYTLAITSGDPTLTYPASSFCNSDVNIIAPIISTLGGTFTASPAGLSIDLTNGEITPNLSSTGTYTIEYSIAGGCTSSSSFTVVINEEDDSSFSYSSDSFCIGETSVATPTFTTLGGTFTASPTGLSFDVLTGVISPGSSLAGTYSITYTTPITKNLNYVIPQQSNLIGHYPLDNNKEDVSGKGFHGTVTGTSNPLSASNRHGTVSSALEFDGDDSIYFGDEMLDEFNGTTRDSFTISIWIKYNVGAQKSFMSLGAYGCNNNTRGAIFRTGGSTSEFSGCNKRGRITGNFADNNWHHYVYRYDKNQGRRVFVDGVSRGVEKAGETNLHNIITSGLTIGGGYHPSSGSFIGFLDDLKIWNTPLTDAEIQNLYNDEVVPPPSPSLKPILGCVSSTTISITITENEDADFTYPEIFYCQATIGTVTPTITGILSGTFTSSPTGLVIDPSTGIITPELSSVATYTIEYTTPGACEGTSSFTLSITDFEEDASFNYPDLSYCKSTIGTVTPSITGVSSGSFTASPTGLIIDPVTGIITPELSAVATYTIEYTTPGICSTTSSVTFVIKQTDDPTFSYSSDLFCKGLSALVTPTIVSLGGTFTSSPTGLSIDSLTGLINPEISLAGVYSITYTNSSTFGCVSTTTISITIAEKASGTLSYPHEDIILDAKFCARDANIIPTVVSTVSGTFSSSPSGLDIDPISGKIKFSSSSPGNYTVLYEMPSLYCGTTTLSKTIAIKGNCDGSDTDGDGVPDNTELLPPYNSDPLDGCSYYFVEQHRDFVSAAWAALDCDGDGVANEDELSDNTDPTNSCSYKSQSITLPITAIGLDCDEDGVPGYIENSQDKTDSLNSCSLVIENISLTVYSLEDCDGDGVSNADEASDKTNPLDGCSFALSRSGKGKTKAWKALDCDGDGVLNGNEERDGTDVFNNCSYFLSSMTINPTKGFDCDGDGVTNWQEIQSFTDPTDECDLDPSTIDFEISNEWYETDCDGDNFKNSVDVFPFYKLEWFDTDNDLVGNNKDLDDDNDGIIDTEEGDDDIDNDGKSNAMDTDSDGDGCPDAIEAGYSDPDNNGILGSGTIAVDSNGKVLSNGGYSQIADNDSNNIYDYLEFGSKVDIITNPNKTYEIYRQSSIEISATAEAKSPISYKWQLNKNGASISSKSNGWEDINDNQDYTGTKTDKLSILNPQFSMEGWKYRLVTFSPCYVCGGETISEPAELIISELFIPSAFSPDGDGINDTWNIRGGLYNYPNNNLVIFNRWGLKIYEADGYNNNWDGTNKGNSNSGNDSKLPVGTYYYVLDLNGNGKNVKKGFIYLTRLNE